MHFGFTENIERSMERVVMSQQPDKLTVIELERIIKNHNDGVQLCQVSLYQQLADTMSENEQLRLALGDVISTVASCHDCWELADNDEGKALVNSLLYPY